MKIQIICLLSLLALLPNIAQAATLSVTGQCNKQVAPDRASIVMTARILEKEASTASKKVAEQYENLRKEVKKLNLSHLQLQTENYSVSPEWNYGPNNKRTLSGYTATMGLKIETSDLSKLGDLLALSSKLGIQDVGSPTPFLSNTLQQKEYEACLKVAVQGAKSKAETMAAAAELSVKELVSMNETRPNENPIPMMAAAPMARAMSDANAANVEIAPLSIQVTIFATYNLK